MFNIIPLILILVSLFVVITIVVKKFSVLATLDIDTIQAEKEIKFKEQIISSRLKRNYFKYYNKFLKIIKPVGLLAINFFSLIYKKLIDFKENYNIEKKPLVDANIKINNIYVEVEGLKKAGELEKAEQKLIEIISLDSRNIKAFRFLADIYFEQKNYNEAKQTLNHILKLIESGSEGKRAEINDFNEEIKDVNSYEASIYYQISLIDKESKSFSDAFENINKTLKIEPNNPRYLDTKLEICIINKDKAEAKITLDALKTANPENKKLDEIKKQIDEL